MSQNSAATPSAPPPYSPIDPSPMGRGSSESVRQGRASWHEPPLPPIPSGSGVQIGAPNPSMRRGHTTAGHRTNRSTHSQTSPTQPHSPTQSLSPPAGSPSPTRQATIINAPPARQATVSNSPPTRQSTQLASTTMARKQEDLLRQLQKFDTVIIVDDSSSMAGPLWFEAREALVQLAELAGKYDTDGLDIHFLNSNVSGTGLVAADIKQLFDTVEPDGITPTGEKLEILLLDYLLKLEHAKAEADRGRPEAMQQVKPVNFLVITDGEPSDDPETVIVTAAKRLDQGRFPTHQVGIQFVQIGNDPEAAEALRELDDDLVSKHGCRDIVDTTPFTGQTLNGALLSKILLGGINKRVDKKGI